MKRKKKVLQVLIFVLSLLGVYGIGHAGLEDGLVAYYSFSGNANDESGNANHGAIHNAIFVDGKFGYGLEFSGSYDSYVEVPHNDSLTPSYAITISLWAKVLNSSGGYASLIYKAGEEPTSVGFRDRIYSLWSHSQGLHFTSTPDGASSQIQCNSPSDLYGLDEFVHFAGVIDTANHTMTIYFNANMVQNCSYFGDKIRGGNYPLRIGGHFHTLFDQFNFNGVIDEVRIYNRALSETEIRELYLLQPTNQPPMAICQDVTVVAGSDCTANASIDNGSVDPDDDSITLSQSPAEPYQKGTTLVTLTVTDSNGASDSCTATVTVNDNEKPIISIVSVTPSILWPANHKMVPVRVTASASDNCGTVRCMIISVTSNEPINGLGDGDTAPDWEITGDLTVNLRAERSGSGSGRIYTITVNCADGAGNSSSQAVTVGVPKDQKK
jgi:hypothetical protein